MDNYKVVWIKGTYKTHNFGVHEFYAHARKHGIEKIPVDSLVTVMEEEVDIELTGRWRVEYDRHDRTFLAFEVKGGFLKKDFWLYDYQIEIIRAPCVNTCGPTEEQVNVHPWY